MADMHSVAEQFAVEDGEFANYGAMKSASSRRSRGAAILAVMAGVAVVLTAIVLLADGKGSSRTELEGADMKEIDGLLSHINKITHDARSGHREDSHAHQELQEKSDEDSTSAPPAVKKGIDHVSKALEDVQKAEQSMKSHEGGEHQSHMSSGKKEAMIKKMQALQAQIAGDFKHVTTFGNKAGFLPPVKVPHV